MFNTLLRQLRLSIDYALTGSYDGAVSLGTKIIKEHEERMFQEAVIKTVGAARGRGAERGGEGRGGAQGLKTEAQGGVGPRGGKRDPGKGRGTGGGPGMGVGEGGTALGRRASNRAPEGLSSTHMLFTDLGENEVGK